MFQRYVDDEIVDADNDTNHGHNDVTNDNDEFDDNDDNNNNDTNDGNDDNNDSPNYESCAYSSQLSSGRKGCFSKFKFYDKTVQLERQVLSGTRARDHVSRLYQPSGIRVSLFLHLSPTNGTN